jgi:hypothetical protein
MSKWGRRRIARRLLGLAVVTAALIGLLLWPGWHEATPERRMAGLRRTRDALQRRLAELRARDALLSSAPEGDVLVGVPEPVGAELLGQLTAGFLHEVEIGLYNLRVRKAGQARVKTPFGRMTPGVWALDVRVHAVHGTLEPGAPKLSLGGERLGVEIPVRIVRGEGLATLRFRWDSRGLGGVACEDFEAEVPAAGTVVPRTYTAKGAFQLTLEDGVLTAHPSFPDLKVNLAVEPSRETWQELERVLARRSLRCRTALKLVDVPGLVRGLLDRGFNVKVPQKIFRPLRLPIGLERRLRLEGRTYTLEATPREVRAARHVLWYAADVQARATEDGPS